MSFSFSLLIAYNVPDAFYLFLVEQELVCPPRTAQRQDPLNKRPEVDVTTTAAEVATSPTSTAETITVADSAVPADTVTAANEVCATTAPASSIAAPATTEMDVASDSVTAAAALQATEPATRPTTAQYTTTGTNTDVIEMVSVGCQTCLDPVKVDASTQTDMSTPEIRKKKSFFRRLFARLRRSLSRH